MPDSTNNAVLYSAVYDNVEAAKADLSAFEELREAEVIGKYDAAVVDKENGEPHIVQRVDHPAYRVIAEWFGSGALPRRQLHDVAQSLGSGEAALIVVGEATLEKAWDKAVTGAARTVKHDLNTTIDELAKELTQPSE
jgi:hypothetical protein